MHGYLETVDLWNQMFFTYDIESDHFTKVDNRNLPPIAQNPIIVRDDVNVYLFGGTYF